MCGGCGLDRCGLDCFGRNRFSLGVLQRVVVHVPVVLCACGIPGCRSRCNGCMKVVTFCCHVRTKMPVSHVMFVQAL